MFRRAEKLRAEIWGTDMDRYVLQHPVEVIGDILVDADAFFRTRSTCEMCGKACTWGSTIPEETAARLETVLDEIHAEFLPHRRREGLGWHYSPEYKALYTNLVDFEKDRKACCFLYKSGAHELCAIYSWAVKHDRPLYDYWPFECIMYPVALLPYDGLLYPGKTLLTLRLPQNWHLVTIYGNRPANQSVYGIWRREFKMRLRRKLSFFSRKKKKRPKLPKLEPHFCERPEVLKPFSYVYYRRVLEWYFGEEFYNRLCALAEKYQKPEENRRPAETAGVQE